MTDQDAGLAPEPIAVDVAGQPGGPSLEEQARVDAEQRDLLARMAAERAPAEADEARARNDRIQAAMEAMALRRSLAARFDELEKRVKALEAARG